MERYPFARPSTTRSPSTRGPLRASATIEAVSLAVLLINIATANAAGIAALAGPVHGIAWLFGIIAVWRDPYRTTGIAVLSAIPGIGGMLALRALNRAGHQHGGAHGDIA